MKKVTMFLGVLALTAGMAFGQSNDANVDQTGNGNESITNQQGMNNYSFTSQINGDDNGATIRQIGNANEAWVTQGMVKNQWGWETSDVPGNNNDAIVSQRGIQNMVSFNQAGDGNDGTITQNGNRNTAYAYQGWTYGFWGETWETSALSSYNSTVNITQVSNDNLAAVWQYGGSNNEVNLGQHGKNNSAQVAQGFIYEDADYDFNHPIYNVKNNTASIRQIGDDNSAKLFQLGNGNTFSLTQNGNNNTIGGRGLEGGLGPIRNGYFEQDGNVNTFSGVQNDGATIEHSSRQTGDYNDILLYQGKGDITTIIQEGNRNTVILGQYGGSHVSEINQIGNSNSATVTQQN